MDFDYFYFMSTNFEDDKSRVSISIRISKELADRIGDLAKKDERSVTQVTTRAVIIGLPLLERQFSGKPAENPALNEGFIKAKR